MSVSIIMIACARPLIVFMQQDTAMIEQTVTYVRLETVAALFSTLWRFMSVVLVTLKKDNYILKQEEKDKLVSYIDSVSKTNEEYKKIQTLSVTLNNVDTEIKENHEKIKTLTENNEALTLRVETLTKNIKNKDEKIEELKEENHSLKNTLEFWKDKFWIYVKFLDTNFFSNLKLNHC